MVNRELKTPYYIQVYERLLEAITDGEYKHGDMLPPEKELGTMYNVDRQTIRRSLELLVNEGIVEKRAGVGSFIKDSPAGSEAKSGTGTLSFILPSAKPGMDRIAEPFNAKLFSAIERECRRSSLYLTYTTVNTISDLDTLPDTIEGIFIVSHVADDVISEIVRRDVPALAINNFHPDCISVLEDSSSGAEAAVKHLIELGHRKIGYIGGIPGYVTSEERFTGYIKALIAADLDWQNMPRRTGDWTFDGGFRAMQHILSENDDPPTAVFSGNDMMAFGAIEAVSSADMQVPDDISIVGFDDIDQCRYMKPNLTTVAVNIELTAQVATHTLHHMLSSSTQDAYKIIIPTKLVSRDSTANPEHGD